MDGRDAHHQSQMADAANVRHKRQLLKLNTREFAEAEGGPVFELHFGETVLFGRQGKSFFDGGVNGCANPNAGFRPSDRYRTMDHSDAHDSGVRQSLPAPGCT